MKNILLLTAFTLIVFTANARQYTLFVDGNSDYSIVVSSDASESEQYAAKELQKYIKVVGGVQLPIVGTGRGVRGKRIIVGYNEDAKKVYRKLPIQASEDESFTYRNSNGDILIYGGSDRGTMYGVFSFLEEELGVRWYAADCTLTPMRKKYVFGSLLHSEKPGIALRNSLYKDITDQDFRSKLRLNYKLSTTGLKPKAQPGGTINHYGAHTMATFVPVDKYFGTHPEYFALVNGERLSKKTQLCLTNPDVLNLCIDGMRAKMKERPEFSVYMMSQYDNRNYCQCEKCQEIVKREGGESGIYLWFVNQVADALRGEFPDKYVGYSAYQGTLEPPATERPRENVVVQLGTSPCCFAHGMEHDDYEKSQMIVSQIKRWTSMTGHMYLWDYALSYYQLRAPYPDFNALQPNMQFYRRCSVEGVMVQGAHLEKNCEFSQLRLYVLSKLLWNPDCDVDAVVDDFMQGYYGPAGKYVREYYNLMMSLVTPEHHFTTYITHSDSLYTDKFEEEAHEIFVKAKQVVSDNEVLLRRVQMAEMPVDYIHCIRNAREAVMDGTYERFMTMVKKEGFTILGKGGGVTLERFTTKLEKAKAKIKK